MVESPPSGRYQGLQSVDLKKEQLRLCFLFFLQETLPWVIILPPPPLPRYLFVGCCQQAGHCPNVSGQSYSSRLLSDTIGLKSLLMKTLSRGLTNMYILDLCCATDCYPTEKISMRLSKLQAVTVVDCLHRQQQGYYNNSTHLQGKRPSVQCLPRHRRGFSSPIGSRLLHPLLPSLGGQWGLSSVCCPFPPCC